MEKLLFLILFIALTSHGESWPQFRGPTGQGHIEAADLPLNWSDNKSVTWEQKIAGKAWSSPICVNDQIFLTNAVLHQGNLTLELISVDFITGEINWKKK